MKWARLGQLLAGRSKGTFVKAFTEFLYHAGKEATSESLQSFVQSASGKLVIEGLKKDGLTKADVAKALGSSLEDAATGAFVGALFGGGGAIASNVIGRQAPDVNTDAAIEPTAAPRTWDAEGEVVADEPFNPLDKNGDLAQMKSRLLSGTKAQETAVIENRTESRGNQLTGETAPDIAPIVAKLTDANTSEVFKELTEAGYSPVQAGEAIEAETARRAENKDVNSDLPPETVQSEQTSAQQTGAAANESAMPSAKTNADTVPETSQIERQEIEKIDNLDVWQQSELAGTEVKLLQAQKNLKKVQSAKGVKTTLKPEDFTKDIAALEKQKARILDEPPFKGKVEVIFAGSKETKIVDSSTIQRNQTSLGSNWQVGGQTIYKAAKPISAPETKSPDAPSVFQGAILEYERENSRPAAAAQSGLFGNQESQIQSAPRSIDAQSNPQSETKELTPLEQSRASEVDKPLYTLAKSNKEDFRPTLKHLLAEPNTPRASNLLGEEREIKSTDNAISYKSRRSWDNGKEFPLTVKEYKGANGTRYTAESGGFITAAAFVDKNNNLTGIITEEGHTTLGIGTELYKFIKKENPNVTPDGIASKEGQKLLKRVGENDINSDAIDLKKLYNKDGEFNYETVKEVAGRIGSGQLKITRLAPREEQGRIAGGRRNVEASIISGADAVANRAESPNRRPTRAEKLQRNARIEKHLENYARAEGIWIDYNKFHADHVYLTKGEEAHVYKDSEPGYVVKAIDYDFGKYGISPEDFTDNRISLHNYLFPETKYELTGFTRDADGRFRFIVRQPFIDGKPPHPSARKAYMKRLLGADSESLTPEQYASPDYHIWDLHMKNLLQDKNGQIFVIDSLLELNTPARHLGGIREYKDFAIENTGEYSNDNDSILHNKALSTPEAKSLTNDLEGLAEAYSKLETPEQRDDFIKERITGADIKVVGNEIFANTDAAEILRQAHGISFDKDIGNQSTFLGAYQNSDHTNRVENALYKVMGKHTPDNALRPKINRIMSSYAKARSASEYGDTRIIATNKDAREGLKAARQEEHAHQADHRVGFEHSIGKSVVQASSAGRRAVRKLQRGSYEGASDNVAAMEVTAKLFVDDESETGLTDKQKEDLRHDYIDKLLDNEAELNAIIREYETVSKLGKEATDYAKQRITDVQRNAGSNEPLKSTGKTAIRDDSYGTEETRTGSGQKGLQSIDQSPRNIGSRLLEADRSDSKLDQYNKPQNTALAVKSGASLTTPQREIDAVELVKDSAGNLLAPNGKPSNLNFPQSEIDSIQSVKDNNGNMLAPNGKKSNLNEHLWKIVRTPSFKEWFGDWENPSTNTSKILDANGEPRIIYHGTNKNIVEFSIKDADDESSYWKAIYLTTSPKAASRYALEHPDRTVSTNNANVIPAFVQITNPYYPSKTKFSIKEVKAFN